MGSLASAVCRRSLHKHQAFHTPHTLQHIQTKGPAYPVRRSQQNETSYTCDWLQKDPTCGQKYTSSLHARCVELSKQQKPVNDKSVDAEGSLPNEMPYVAKELPGKASSFSDVS